MSPAAADRPEPTRTESDSLGLVEVPASRYWGAQTERARKNFPIGDRYMPAEIIAALAQVKLAAARCNARFGKLDARLAGAIEAAAAEIVAGDRDEHFPLPPWQSGSGTQTNMNVNEVIANRASELLGGGLGARSPVHPNDHVNLSQSSNDAFPTAMSIAVVIAVEQRLLPALATLVERLRERAERYRDLVKLGRTHLMDATPLTVGRELGSFASQLDDSSRRIEAALGPARALVIGGTAVGTGLHAPEGWDRAMCEEIARLTGSPFVAAEDKLAGQAAHDGLVHLHGAIKTAACAAMKIANDIRWLASGPRGGLGELRLPANEPGSSIMPGKVNPTQCEALRMVCARVFGNDTSITFAGASGDLELNVFKPLIATCCLESTSLLGDALRSFAERLVAGLEVDARAVARHLDRSLMLVTALVPRIGYDRAAELAQRALAEDETLREVVIAAGVLSGPEYDRLVDPAAMARPGGAAGPAGEGRGGDGEA